MPEMPPSKAGRTGSCRGGEAARLVHRVLWPMAQAVCVERWKKFGSEGEPASLESRIC